MGIAQGLVAKFSSSPVTGCPPLIVNFKDESTGAPTSWRWDFGNGSSSNQQNPNITYFLPGSYTVKLVVKNASNADSVIKTQHINVNLPPVVNFGASSTTGCSPLPVQFTDSSLSGFGNIVSWQWDFGDGNSSTLQNPFHVYRGSGNFTVTLWVTNSSGCVKLFTRPAYIQLLATPDANFAHSISQGCSPPATVTFNNTSTSLLPFSYFWDFGNGNTSTERNPIQSYINSGVYSPKLVITNNNGCADTLAKPDAIKVQFARADFSVPAGICAGTPLTITNTSLPGSVAAQWSFSDGTFSNAINPVKTFANTGVYQVKLVNNFGSCIDSVIKTITVTSKPTPSFTATNTSGCRAPLTVAFNNTSANAAGYLWKFGDGATATDVNPTHTYTQPGNYQVTLTAINSSGCADSIIKSDFIQIRSPKILSLNDLPAKGCLPYTITPSAVIQTPDAVASYFWDFGDGGTSASANPSYTYTSPGSYTVKLIIITSTGCTDTLIQTRAVNVGNKPVASLAAFPVTACANVSVNFTDQSTGNATEWLWLFGDGAISNLQNPAHLYSDTGKFSITLIATNYGCSDTLVEKDYVYVLPPVAVFDTALACSDRLTRTFIDKSIAADSWRWDFGDGGNSSQPNPKHTFPASGSYTVKLTVTNGACTSTMDKVIKVLGNPGQLTASTQEICRGKQITFDVGNIQKTDIIRYTWHPLGLSNPSGGTTTQAPFSFAYPSTGSHLPAVVTTDSIGCMDTLLLGNPVKIYGPSVAFAPASPGVCFATPLQFLDSSVTDGIHPITQWVWNFGDGGSRAYSSPPFEHTYNYTGTFGISLSVTDSYGCTDSLFKPNVVTVSKADAKFTSADSLTCPGAPVQFTNQSVGSGIGFSWDFGDGGTSNVENPVHSYTSPGTYTIRLITTNTNGCPDTLIKNNFIRVDKPVAKFQVSDSFICQPIQILFTDSSRYATSWSWTFDNGNTSTLQNPVNVFSSSRLYTVKLVVTGPGGCKDSAFKPINVDLLSGTLTYSPITGCAPMPITFTASSSRQVDYIWNFGDGNSITTIDSIATNTYTTLGKFLPQILLRDVRGCTVPVNGKDSIVVEKILPKVSASHRSLCDSGMVQFADSSISMGAMNYQWFFGDGGTSNVKNPSHFYTASGSYDVRLILTSSLFGCQDSIIFPNYIRVTTTVAPAVTITASATTICAGKPITFIAHPVNGGTTPVYEWKVNGNNIGVGGDTLVINSLADNDVVSCVLRSSLQCITTPAIASNDITITVVPNLTPAVTITPSSTNICIRTSATFIAVPVNGGTNPLYQWKVNDRNVGNNTNTYTSNNFSNGDIITCVITSSEVCTTEPTATSNAVRMNVYAYPQVNAGPDLIVLQGWKGVLNPSVSAVEAKYKWTPSIYLSNDSELRPVSTPQSDVTYKLTVTGIGGCSASDEVFIKVLKLYIPNVFSPNGDGINDKWLINNLQFFPEARVDIFNRYGQLLFRSTGYEHPWDGTYNGSPLPVGVYYYVIELKNQGVKPFGGSVTLLR